MLEDTNSLDGAHLKHVVFIKFQCNQNDTFSVNKNYDIIVVATISSVQTWRYMVIVQNYGAAFWYEMKTEDKF